MPNNPYGYITELGEPLVPLRVVEVDSSKILNLLQLAEPILQDYIKLEGKNKELAVTLLANYRKELGNATTDERAPKKIRSARGTRRSKSNRRS